MRQHQLILNAISRIETDLLIIKQELARLGETERVVKVTKKQSRMERCLKMIAHQRILDEKRAKKMFSAKIQAVNEKLKKLNDLGKANRPED